jgi:hypothetical protein
MNRFNAMGAGASIVGLNGLACACQQQERKNGRGTPAKARFLEEVRIALQNVITVGHSTRVASNGLVRFDSGNVARSALNYIDKEPNVTTIKAHLVVVSNAVIKDLHEHEFFSVAQDRSGFVGQEQLFGEKVHQAFPSAREDLMAAGDCLAAECGTAAVFHLMRVAEIGLRALAQDRRVAIPKNKPLELATWEDIIRELEGAEKEIHTYPKTLAREAQYEFYHGALMQFRAFKNVFRNQVAHTRKAYDRLRAESVFNQVKDFMKILATRINENARTPKIWKGKKWITAS